MESSNCPWHAADLDGLYVVRDRNEKVVFEHAKDFSRDQKLRHILLAAAAPELLLSLSEMLLLAEPFSHKKFKTISADFKIACERARSIIKKTAP